MRCLLLVVIAGATGCRTVVDFAAISDGQTAANVKTALVNDTRLGTTIIEVRVEGGIAHLSGTVSSPADEAHAAALARNVPNVTQVVSNLRIGGNAPVPTGPQAVVRDDDIEPPSDPRLLALGASLGWTEPRGGLGGGGIGVGPLVRLGSGRGLGISLGLGWYQVSMPPEPGGTGVRSRIHVRPVMGGVGYTFASERVSLAPSIVAGWAFNDVNVPAATGRIGRLAVGVGNSFVWRPGVSLWIDANRRVAFNLSGGYAVTRLPITFLDNGQLRQSRLRADTALLHAGLAYKLF